MQLRLKRQRFEELVAEALDGLPPFFLEHLQNVEVVIEDWPTEEDLEEAGLDPAGEMTLFGLYQGIPLTERTSSYSLVLPDKITIFQGPIQEWCSTEEDVREQVQQTVVHEIAHFFGLSDERLHELGW